MIEERHRDDGFETTFVVSTERRQAWKLLADAAQAPGSWWIPGVESTADELEVVPEERLRVRKAEEPCKGTEIVVTMEDAETGTRITFVQRGFGPDFDARRPWLEAGWWAIRADLFVFFEHGVSPRRHVRPWVGIGAEVRETPGGLVLEHVRPGGFTDQAGAQDGDLLILLAGAPVVTIRELAVSARTLRAGTETELRYLRGSQVLRGRGTV